MELILGNTLKCLRCYNWNNSSNAGVFSLNLNNYRSNSNNNVSFRDSYPKILKKNIGNNRDVLSRLSRNLQYLFFFLVEKSKIRKENILKRYGNLFDSTFTMENLYEAYLNARRGKRKKRACFEFETNLGANLTALYNEIHSDTYKLQPYHIFKVYEPKERMIHAPAFRDIVVQHAIYKVIYPIFNNTFISTSFACRKGFGTHKASIYTQKALRRYSEDLYTLKLDVKKFFYSIDRNILKSLLEKKIKDKKFINITMLFTDYEDASGIPIGNLLSQIFALIYLNPIDQYIKRVLKVKDYVRYVDDFILFGLTRDKCIEYKEKIEIFLKENLHLELSKFSIQKIKRGVNFVGYRTWQNYRLIRKHSLYKFKKSLRKQKNEAIMSLLGHSKNTLSIYHLINLIKEDKYEIISLPTNLRQAYNNRCKLTRECNNTLV